MKKIIVLFVLFLIYLNLSAEAKVFQITIDNPNYKPIGIGLWGFQSKDKSSALILKSTIERDLRMSGFFYVDKTQHFSYDAPFSVVCGLSKIDNLDYAVYGNLIVENNDSIYANIKLVNSANKTLMFNGSFYSNKESLKWLGHRVSDKIIEYITGVYGPFESKIIFARGKGKIRDIYACDFNGENIERLTKWHTMNILPKWIDKYEISFLSYKYGKPSLFLFNIRTGKIRKLFSNSNLSISAVKYKNNFAVPFSKNGDVDIYEVNRNGRIIKNFTHNYGIDVSPNFTSDYSKMVFVSNRTSSPQIYVKDLSSAFESSIRLTFNGKYNSSPALSPNNRKIAYISIEKGKTALKIMNIDGSEDKTVMTGYNLDSPSWSYDSRYVAIEAEMGGVRGIYIVNTLNNKYFLAMGGNGMYNGLSVSGRFR